MRYPPSIQNLIDEFSKLPTVGPKTAERYVFYLLKKNPEELKRFADAMANLKNKISVCKTCFSISETDPCHICSDIKRDKSIVCIVAGFRDLITIESTNQYNGLYFILGGTLNAIEGIKPEELNISALLELIKKNNIKEIILALNPNIEGETTSLYLTRLIKNANIQIKITRIAKGLPMGADIEYADEMTIANALQYRNEL